MTNKIAIPMGASSGKMRGESSFVRGTAFSIPAPDLLRAPAREVDSRLVPRKRIIRPIDKP